MASTAVATANWRRRQGKRSSQTLAPFPGSGAPVDGGDGGLIGLTVELYMGDAGWVDISDRVYYRDRIRISRGRQNETSQTPPQTAGLTLNNRGGRFTPRNATGPYYGLIGRNTPIRISRMNNGVRRYRYCGEVPSWPTTSDISGQDVYEQIGAAGPLRRIQQGSAPLRSPMERAYTLGVTSSLVTAYWPCEDAAGSTQFASGLTGGAPLAISGSPTLASNTAFACSAALPAVNGSTWSGPISPFSNTTANVVRFLLSVPSGGDPNSGELIWLTTTGTVATLQLAYNTTPSIQLQVLGQDAAGNSLFNNAANFSLNGNPSRVSLELLQSGSNVIWAIVVIVPGGSEGSISGSISGTVGQATSIIVNNHISGVPVGLTTSAIGHISYQPTWDSLFDLSQPLNAWSGEPPDAVQANDTGFTTSRFTRLCLEQNINPVVVTSAAGYDIDPGPTPPVGMGNQTIDTFAALLQQVPDTTAGMIFEPRDQVGVAIRTRASLYNQPAKLTLDHSQHQLSAPLNPVDDDQQTRNDITVARGGGSSVVLQQTTGSLSIQPPPAGVGDYQTQYSLSLASDSLLSDAAGWRLHLGTVDEPRYPQISLNLRHPTFTGNVDMLNAALTLDIGDRIVIVNPPPELPPDPISLIVQGYTETLGNFEHDMVINCSPESPYRVGLLDDTALGHLDTDGSTLAQAYPLGTETTIQVATANAASPAWTTNSGTPWSFTVTGSPVANNYFIVGTGQAASISVGDTFGIGGVSAVCTVTSISPPAFGLNNIFFTPSAASPVNNPTVVTQFTGDFPFDIMAAGERMTVTSIANPAIGVDGTFESGVAGWTTIMSTLAQSSAQAHSGTFSGLLTATSAVSTARMDTAHFAVSPGATYQFSYWMMLASGTPNFITPDIMWFAADNVTSVGSASGVSLALTGSWVFQQLTAVAPAGAAFALAEVSLNPSLVGDAAYVDDLTFVQTLGGTQPFTVVRSVNGVVKGQTAGTDVRLAQPMIPSL